MAYRPARVPPPNKRSPRGVVEAAARRQALAKALASRLQMLLAAREQPILPPRAPISENPNIPPMDPRTQGWVPPSAYDWIRQPGFYDEPDSGVDARYF